MSDYMSGRKKLDVEIRPSGETPNSSSNTSVDEGSAEGFVRYKGSKESSIYKSSDEVFEYSCDPCSSVGDHLEAEGYCTDCDEYLCGTCFKSHSRSKATKNHRLLNKANTPRKPVKMCVPCKTAGEEIDAVGYCSDCEEYLCSNCFKSHERSKATKRHNLMDTIPEESESDVASSIAKVDIQKGNTGDQKYNEKYTYVRKIKVKDSWREKNNHIIAMTLLSNTELVLADSDNKSLKLVDTERNTVKGTLNLKSHPLSITTVSEVQVAVALYEIRVIQIITVARKLSIHRNINLSGRCLCTEFRNGKLYAAFHNPVTFQILQLSGAVHKTIKPDSEVLKHCTTPSNIAVCPEESLIYVSDWNSNSVLSIDMDGNMIYMYQSELEMPQAIATSPFGSVYLCIREHNALYKMTPDLKDATVILGQEDLCFPFAMCFSAEKQHLYISSGSAHAKECNYIKVFKLQ